MAEPAGPTRLFRGKAAFWLPIAPLVALDLWSKAAVFRFLRETYRSSLGSVGHPVVGSQDDLISFQLVAWKNTGTIWGIAQGYNGVLVALRLVAVVAIVWFMAKLPAAARGTQLLLGVILAGALGNLYDNLTQEAGGVRDFLLFTGEVGGAKWTFPAFNVADSCICVGAILLAVAIWRAEEPAARPE